MHRNTCYAKSNLSPPDPVRLIIKPFFGVIQGPRWTVVMCLQRLSLVPISYKYAVPARLRGVSRFPLSHYPRFYYPPLNSSISPYVSRSPYFQIGQLPTDFR